MSRARYLDRDVRLSDERPRLGAHGPVCSSRPATSRRDRRATPTSSSINTCSVREHAEEKLYTRLGELRVLGEETGAQPVVAVAGCVAQQERRRAVCKTQRHADRRGARHAAAALMLPVLIERARATAVAARSDVDRRRRRDVLRSGRDARGDRRQGLRHHHRGLQRSLRLLRRAAHARPRAHARRRPDILRRRAPRPCASGRQRDSAARADRQSLPGARTIRAATSRSCSPRSTTCPGVERIRFASPHPRHTGARLIDAVRDLPEGLQAPPPARAVRLHRGAAGDAAAPHARGVSRLVASASARPFLASRCRPIMIVGFPGETRRRLRRDAVARRGRRGITACSRSSIRRGRTRWRRSGCPDDVSEDEKTTARIVGLQALQREIQIRAARRRGGRAASSRCSWTR